MLRPGKFTIKSLLHWQCGVSCVLLEPHIVYIHIIKFGPLKVSYHSTIIDNSLWQHCQHHFCKKGPITPPREEPHSKQLLFENAAISRQSSSVFIEPNWVSPLKTIFFAKFFKMSFSCAYSANVRSFKWSRDLNSSLGSRPDFHIRGSNHALLISHLLTNQFLMEFVHHIKNCTLS